MKRTPRTVEEAPLDGAFAIDKIRRELAELSPHMRAELDRHVLDEMDRKRQQKTADDFLWDEPPRSSGNGEQPGKPPRTEPPRKQRSKLRSKKGSDITMQHITWVWPGRIAKGKHTAIAGEPGIGKSQLALWVGATVTKGGPWGREPGIAPKGGVVLFSAEDGAADTIVPRFLAAGGDAEKLHIVTATENEDGSLAAFNLQTDLAALEAKIKEVGDVVLVIIDPISSYLGKTDSHRNTEVRGAIEPLSEMADRLAVAVVSITHFNKGSAGNKTRALHKVIGSIAFVGAPRMAFAVVEEADDTGRRLFLPIKHNIAPPAKGLAYRLEQAVAGYIGNDEPVYASRIAWDDEPVDVTADQAIAEHEESLRGEKGEGRKPAREKAEKFLLSWLKDGPRPAAIIERAACEADISERTLARLARSFVTPPKYATRAAKLKGTNGR
jgi:AAA domain